VKLRTLAISVLCVGLLWAWCCVRVWTVGWPMQMVSVRTPWRDYYLCRNRFDGTAWVLIYDRSDFNKPLPPAPLHKQLW
jgi:hypothetical protein